MGVKDGGQAGRLACAVCSYASAPPGRSRSSPMPYPPRIVTCSAPDPARDSAANQQQSRRAASCRRRRHTAVRDNGLRARAPSTAWNVVVGQGRICLSRTLAVSHKHLTYIPRSWEARLPYLRKIEADASTTIAPGKALTVPRRFGILHSFLDLKLSARTLCSSCGRGLMGRRPLQERAAIAWFCAGCNTFLVSVPTALGHVIVSDDAMHTTRNKMGRTMP